MSVIVTRAAKGSALTWAEADANYTNLNNGKAEASNSTLNGTASVEGLKMTQRTVTAATYTAVTSDYTILCNTTSNSITVSLPTAVGNKGLTYEVKKLVAANTVTIDPNGTQTIDGATTVAITSQYEALVLRSDGANWVKTSNFSIAGGGGTVTSVAMSGGTTGLTFSGGPVTGAGTFTAGGTLITANGGTGFGSYAVGDLLQASTTTALAKLVAVATGNVLLSGGVGVVSAWGKVGLTTHVSGTLPVANGGTGATASTGTGNVVLATSPTIATPVFSGRAVLGGFSPAYVAKSAAYTLTTSDFFVTGDTTAAGFSLTLPTAVAISGQCFRIKKIAAANNLTVATTSAQTIDGATTVVLDGNNDFIEVMSDGANWRVTDKRMANDSYNSISGVAVTASSYFLGGNVYAGGGAIMGWQTGVTISNDGNASVGTATFNKTGGGLGRVATGGLLQGHVAKTAAYTTTAVDHTITCDCTTAGFTLTLHTAVGNTGQEIRVIKINATNTLTMGSTSSQTINGAAPGGKTLTTQWSFFTFVSDGANWLQVN
jgi:hypothetical protein